MKKYFLIGFPAILFLLLAAERAQAAKPGYISGRAVTEDGRPVPNFEVFYIGSNAGGTVSGRIVGKNGSYSIAAPPNSVVGLHARAIADFDGQKYALQMEATDGKTANDAEPTSRGIVRNFVWKLKGLQPGQTEKSAAEYTANFPYAYYGGAVKLDADTQTKGSNDSSLRYAFPAESTIAVTLTPQGSLVDGSQGQAITQTINLADAGTYGFYLRNIPVGTYSATAVLTTPTGEKKQLRAKVYKQAASLNDSTWARTVTVSFPASAAHNNGGGGGTEFAELYLAPPGEDDAAAAVQPNAPTKPPTQSGDNAPQKVAEPNNAFVKYAQPDFSEVTPYYTVVKWDYDFSAGLLNMVVKPKAKSRPTDYDVEYLDAAGTVLYSQNISFSSSSTDVGQTEKTWVTLMFGEKDLQNKVKSIRFVKRR